MAKGMYIGVGNVARKVKKAYVGIGGVARKVKKMYIGIGGTARLCFSSGPSKVNSVTNLTHSMYGYDGVSNEVYALFTSDTRLNAYNSNLIQSVPSTTLEYLRTSGSAKSSQYAIFILSNSSSSRNPVNAYNGSLTRVVATEYGSSSTSWYMSGMIGGTVDDTAIFAGGISIASGYYAAIVTKYNMWLTKEYASSGLGQARANALQATIGTYIIFAGGNWSGGVSSAVDVFTSSLVKTTPAALLKVTRELKAASNNSYAIFPLIGDALDNSPEPLAAYNSNLVRTDFTGGTYRVGQNSGVSTPELAIFAGGRISNPGTTVIDTVSAFDKNLVRSELEQLSESKFHALGARIGNYAIFAGGYAYVSPTNKVTVDAYEF